MRIVNMRTKDTCVITFEKSGWLGRSKHDIHGYVKDAHGQETHIISGKWSRSIEVKYLTSGLMHPRESTVTVWSRPPNNSVGKYNLTEFAQKLLEFDSDYESILPGTDSRLRPDRRALERGDRGDAGIYKSRLEEKQRGDKKERAARREEWYPRWFKQKRGEDGVDMWVYTGGYWEARQKKVDLLRKKKNHPESVLPEEEKLIRELAMGSGISGLACDFKSYVRE